MIIKITVAKVKLLTVNCYTGFTAIKKTQALRSIYYAKLPPMPRN